MSFRRITIPSFNLLSYSVSKHPQKKRFVRRLSSSSYRNFIQRSKYLLVNTWMKSFHNKKTFILVGLLSVLTFMATSVPIHGFFKDIFNYFSPNEVDKVALVIKESEVINHRPKDHPFIPCPKIQEEIHRALTDDVLQAGRYTIVYGPPAFGKTALITQTALGKKGVV